MKTIKQIIVDVCNYNSIEEIELNDDITVDEAIRVAYEYHEQFEDETLLD